MRPNRIKSGMLWMMISMTLSSSALASPESFHATRAPRSILEAPDRWANMRQETSDIDLLCKQLPEKERIAVKAFRGALLLQEPYFADRQFQLSPEERKRLLTVIRSYEEQFHAEYRRLESIYRDEPIGAHGRGRIGYQARMAAERDIDQLSYVFSRHNWTPDRPHNLAAAYIAVLRAFGTFLEALTEMPIQPSLNETSDSNR